MAELQVTDADLAVPHPVVSAVRPLGAPELVAPAATGEESQRLRSLP
jgi:hypothetical protein